MSQKSWQINRRRMLQGVGTALSLPMLDGMMFGSQKEEFTNPKKRLCSVYFPYGVQMQGDLSWFPQGEGKDYTFSKPLESLKPHKEDITIFGGLSHPLCRKMNGHATADIFLTGSFINLDGVGQTESLDTFASHTLGKTTRYQSLVLSTDEGVGEFGRRNTCSTTPKGRAIPPMVSPWKIYNHLFDKTPANARELIVREKSMLDALLEDSKSLSRQLGVQDRRKLDEYMSSVRDSEKKAHRAEGWLNTAKPKVDPNTLALDKDAAAGSPKEYLRCMYDLMFIALQTDSTRVISYSIGNQRAGASAADTFPELVTGKKGNLHKIDHSNSSGLYDTFLAAQFSYFVDRLKNAQEGEHSLLDNTMVLYGSSNSKTHNNTNYPLVLAGGSKLGLKHGQFRKYSASVPLSNLFLTMLHGLGVEADSFADSNGRLMEML